MDKFKAWTLPSRLWLYRLLWRIKFLIFRERIPKNKDGKIYLNLGSGVNTSSEFINIDAFPFRKTHLVLDIRDLSVFPNESVDMVYASHVLEHIPRSNLLGTLAEWRRVLKPGGILRFGVPDFDKLIDFYNASGKETDSIINQLLGQDQDFDRHCTIWNFNYAKKILKEAGFSGQLRPWDVESAEHHEFHDKSNRDNSLNLEVTK
ncbi:MAG: methyltransferase domain-containing protein [bacterium]|nr:methyltransferase domain-containing protein [bacterium]